MDNKNTPAYPHAYEFSEKWGGDASHADGFTKREIVAAMCLQGMLANHYKGSVGTPWDILAKEATEAAEALLTHLEKTSK